MDIKMEVQPKTIEAKGHSQNKLDKK